MSLIFLLQGVRYVLYDIFLLRAFVMLVRTYHRSFEMSIF